MTLTSHERHGVSNHRQLNCSFKSCSCGCQQRKLQTSALLVLCEVNPLMTSQVATQRYSKCVHVIASSWHFKVSSANVGCFVQRLKVLIPLQWRHNGRDSVSNHKSHHCLLIRAFRRKSKKTPKLCVTGDRRIHRGPVNSPYKWQVTRKMFPFDEVIMRGQKRSSWPRQLSSLKCKYTGALACRHIC